MTSEVAYQTGIQPSEYLLTLKHCIHLLDKSVGAARSYQPKEDDARATCLDFLVGFGMLALSEVRALLSLVSLGYERSARIHLRSLFEYTIRAQLVQNPETARAFKAAATVELDRYAKAMGREKDEGFIAARERYLEGIDPEDAGRERDAFGGNMRKLVESLYPGDTSAYERNFAFPSLFSHGSILALNEVRQHVSGRGSDFIRAILSDGSGPMLLNMASAELLRLVHLLMQELRVEVDDEWHALTKQVGELLHKGQA